MRIIYQKDKLDCGVAVAAMCAGVPYRTALRALGWDEMDRGLWVADFCRLCAELGVHLKTRKPSPYRPLADASGCLGPNVVALIVRARNKKFGHYVAFNNGRVYDPEVGKHPLRSYPRARWDTVRVFLLAENGR